MSMYLHTYVETIGSYTVHQLVINSPTHIHPITYLILDITSTLLMKQRMCQIVQSNTDEKLSKYHQVILLHSNLY